MTTNAARPGEVAQPQDSDARSVRILSAVLGGLLFWLIVQTPVAVAAYQYLGVPASGAQALLLVKDAATAVLLVVLALRYARSTRWHRFDVAALVYVVILGAYAVVPLVTGSSLPLLSVAASVREFLVPVELYALGRLAASAGVSLRLMCRWFVAVSVAAALFTVGMYVIVPETFWSSDLNLLRFIRDVQGIASATSLWAASLVGHFGVGAGVDAQFPRAVGPFTHPVGTAHYFATPFVLAAAAAMSRTFSNSPRLTFLLGWLVVAILGLAVITPISRAAWLAAVAGIGLAGILLARVRMAAVIAAAFIAFVIFVPPFSYSIQSALSLTDTSAAAHVKAIEKGIEVVVGNPGGLGVGHGDVFGNAYGAGRSAGIGENMYLAALVTVGPLGVAALLLWILGVVRMLLTGHSRRAPRWMMAGLGAVLVGMMLSSTTASPLMRFTTSASLWLLVGLAVGTIDERQPLPSWLEVRAWVRRHLRAAAPVSLAR